MLYPIVKQISQNSEKAFIVPCESNINLYGDTNNINSNSILEKIEKKINQIKNKLKQICEEIIDKINMQYKQIEKYLNLRKIHFFWLFNYLIDIYLK